MKAGQTGYMGLGITALDWDDPNVEGQDKFTYRVTRSGLYVVSVYLRVVTFSVTANDAIHTHTQAPEIDFTDNRSARVFVPIVDVSAGEFLSFLTMNDRDSGEKPSFSGQTIVYAQAGTDLTIYLVAGDLNHDVTTKGTLDVHYNILLLDPA